MPRYRVTNRATKESYEIEAPFAQDACRRLGWLIGFCHVALVREGPYSDLLQGPQRVKDDLKTAQDDDMGDAEGIRGAMIAGGDVSFLREAGEGER